MSSDSNTAPGDEIFVLEEPPTLWVSVSTLQNQLRELFATEPLHRAVAAALEQVAAALDADYAVLHARYGQHLLSEEWSLPELDLGEALREQINAAMIAAADAGNARCVRLRSQQGELAVVAATLFGEDNEQMGSVALVFHNCNRAHAYELLVQVESLVGFVALLLSKHTQERARPQVSTPSEPLRLLLELVANLSKQYELDQVAVGVVEGHKVQVALVNHELDLRPSNPGVRLLRDAMAECLDARVPIRFGDGADQGHFRLHAAWRESRGSGVVASLPLLVDGQVVAVVALAAADAAVLQPEALAKIHRELADYTALLPIARLATRSLCRHALDALAAVGGRLLRRHRRVAVGLSAAALLLGWLTFGTLPYRVTVPGIVRPLDRRIVASPRDGVLAEIYVRPGDQIRAGQVLAELDSHDDTLTKAELAAQVIALSAQIDLALSEQDGGKLRVLEAERDGVLAQAALVAHRIEQAKIRATRDGIVLAGELRERLGGRLAMGDPMFELARSDGCRVEMRIEEHLVVDARHAVSATFVPAAAPDTDHALHGWRFAPATTVQDGQNVFLAEAEFSGILSTLLPGMEGFAVLDLGPRPAHWVLTKRLVAWLRLNFWL